MIFSCRMCGDADTSLAVDLRVSRAGARHVQTTKADQELFNAFSRKDEEYLRTYMQDEKILSQASLERLACVVDMMYRDLVLLSNHRTWTIFVDFLVMLLKATNDVAEDDLYEFATHQFQYSMDNSKFCTTPMWAIMTIFAISSGREETKYFELSHDRIERAIKHYYPVAMLPPGYAAFDLFALGLCNLSEKHSIDQRMEILWNWVAGSNVEFNTFSRGFGDRFRTCSTREVFIQAALAYLDKLESHTDRREVFASIMERIDTPRNLPSLRELQENYSFLVWLLFKNDSSGHWTFAYKQGVHALSEYSTTMDHEEVPFLRSAVSALLEGESFWSGIAVIGHESRELGAFFRTPMVQRIAERRPLSIPRNVLSIREDAVEFVRIGAQLYRFLSSRLGNDLAELILETHLDWQICSGFVNYPPAPILTTEEHFRANIKRFTRLRQASSHKTRPCRHPCHIHQHRSCW